MPFVSVVLATYNGATKGFLCESIESVLRQTHQGFELIIVDDGSTDQTKQQCEKYLSDKRVFYVCQENHGVAVARNTGIKRSSGKWICFTDDDDLWLAQKLEKQIAYVQQNNDSKLGMIHTWADGINARGEVIHNYRYSSRGNIFETECVTNVVNAASSVMIKREVFDAIGMFKEHMIHIEDYEMWLRISKHYNVDSVDEVLVQYRIHGNRRSEDCYHHIILYSHLALFYSLDEHNSPFAKDVYKQLYAKFAERRFALEDYREFRRCYKFAKAYGPMGIGLQSRYWLSYFPGIISGVRKLKSIVRNG